MPGFVLGALALFTALLGVFAAAVLFLAGRAFKAAHRYASRRSRDRYWRQRAKTDREIANALGTFGVDISVWPSRAPRNGSTHTPDPDPVE
jgi:hypothetical protein